MDGEVREARSLQQSSTRASTSSAVSSFGSVFGMSATVVTPPATALFVPVSTVSFSAWDQSRRCTWRSVAAGIRNCDRRRAQASAAARPSRLAGDLRDHPVLDVDPALGEPAGVDPPVYRQVEQCGYPSSPEISCSDRSRPQYLHL